jgi:hypothetical protein
VRDLEGKLREAKELRDKSEQELLDDWADEGLDGMKLDGRTLFVSCTPYATFPQGKDAAVELLKASDHAGIVQETVNSNTASALVRELTAEGGDLPDGWAGIIERGERYSIGIRKAR